MSLSSTTVKVSYAGDDSTVSFPVTFVFWDDTDIKAILRAADGTETVWVLGTQYTLTGGSGATGTLTVDTSPTDYTPLTGQTLVIKSARANTQPTAFPLGGAFPSTSAERALDQLTRLIQQRGEEVDRSVKVSESSPSSSITVPEPDAGKFLAWNTAETNLENKSVADFSAVALPLSVANGGTDAATAADARTNLGAAALAGSATQDFSTQNLTINGRQDLKTGANIASAATINLATATGNLVHITGTTPTSAITMTSGQWMRCIADAAWPLTYHATTNRISGGVDYTCAVGDTIDYFYDGTTVIGNITKKDGTAVVDVDVGITLGTAVAATSGTYIYFSGIPATAKRVTLVLAGVSTNGTSPFIVQIGDVGGIETNGYTSGAGSRSAEVTSAIGFILNQAGGATGIYTAVIPITLFDTNSWATSGALNRVSDGFAQTFGGQKILSGTLDRVLLTTVNGTDTFDAGTVNITYES